NYNRRNKNGRLYEMAKIYLPKALPLTELPDERVQFTLGFYGDGDFFDMKGVMEDFIRRVGMKKTLTYKNTGEFNFLHPGRQAVVSYAGVPIGYLGEVHPKVCETYDLGDRTYIGVLDMPKICEYASFDLKYEGIARFPAVTRDLSMVMKKSVLAGDIEEVIRKNGGKLLEEYRLFDIYEGSQILEGHKSMAYSVTLRSKDHTLTDEEITKVMNGILKGLSDLGVELRQ
ncbi:MAG: phenylalanine--tRNA ligase subunit beta, partial [Lachnospiraceae bacterium]|nr:phenylalanine--tRNA ligase subunit beta [Lachnospiraceae bacterium]